MAVCLVFSMKRFSTEEENKTLVLMSAAGGGSGTTEVHVVVPGVGTI